jgi:hypothetical protein
MTIDRYLRMIAGAFVLLTLALGYWVSPYWYLFTAFVGLNLFQSAFTNWCPMMTFLRKLGVRSNPITDGSKEIPGVEKPRCARIRIDRREIRWFRTW